VTKAYQNTLPDHLELKKLFSKGYFMEKMLLNTNETAKTLSICTKTLWTLTKQGAIPCVRIGARVLYHPKDLERWIESQKKLSKTGLEKSSAF
jgi:predicted DNA-binding transcriptional regulator AlpA